MPATLEQRTCELPGGRSQVVFVAGDGPPLVWLHGINGPEADAAIILALSERYQVLAPLAPGFANLDELHELRDIHDLALHYDDVLDALRIEQAVLAGLSFGAMIAAEYAAHYPKRVSRLILISPVGLWNDAYPVADLWSVPSFTELAREGHEVQRWNLLHPTEEKKLSHVEMLLKDAPGPVIASTDYVRALTEQIRACAYCT